MGLLIQGRENAIIILWRYISYIMWMLKFTASTDNTKVGSLAAKHRVVVQLYPLLTNRVKGHSEIQFYGIVFGPDENKQTFLQDFSALSEVLKVRQYDDSFIFKYREKEHHVNFYNPEVLFIEPWTLDGVNRVHRMTLGAWSRSHLVEVYNNIKEHHDTRLLSLKISRMKAPALVFCNVRPPLTSQQRMALDLAIQNGYYEHPRNVSVKELAEMAKLSFSTFQAHLRKAEKRIIPYSHQLLFSDKYR